MEFSCDLCILSSGYRSYSPPKFQVSTSTPTRGHILLSTNSSGSLHESRFGQRVSIFFISFLFFFFDFFNDELPLCVYTYVIKKKGGEG